MCYTTGVLHKKSSSKLYKQYDTFSHDQSQFETKTILNLKQKPVFNSYVQKHFAPLNAKKKLNQNQLYNINNKI